MEQSVPIFISYAREDNKMVFPILDRLRAEGFQCWIDQEGIEGAAFWRKEIVKAIELAPVILFFASQASCRSDNVSKELALASEERKPILPVFLDTVRPPAELRYQIVGLQHVNWHDDPERALSQISVALRHYTSPMVVSEPIVLPKSHRARWLVVGIATTGVIALVVIFAAYHFFGSQLVPYIQGTWFTLPIYEKIPGQDVKEMVLVPAGLFAMGSTEEEVEAAYQLAKQYSPEVNKVWYEPEQPRHWVWVDAFYMDKHKVTLEDYQIFMREREKPYQELPDWTSKYANIPKHPVVGVSWEDAVGYCRWARKQLPTEAQWEKAARGTDGRWYPWGSEPVDGKRANYCDAKCEFSWKDKNQEDGYRYLSPVGAYELGKSFYGIYDLAGNVWEWVQDWYDIYYYSKSYERNPVNDKEAQYRVVRGGSWDSDPSFLRASYRNWQEPNSRTHFVGFRCVLPAAPEH